MYNIVSLDEVRTIKSNHERTVKMNVEVGDRARIGSTFAFENDYEIYINAEGRVAYVWPDAARAAIILNTGKLVPVIIEDCIKVVK